MDQWQVAWMGAWSARLGRRIGCIQICGGIACCWIPSVQENKIRSLGKETV
jgi:hypothetical protein